MGESLHCDLCGKPAHVHLTKVVKNQFQKVDLCEECAQSKGVTDSETFSLAALLAKSFADPAEETEGVSLVCEQCGYTARDFKKSGRLGCAACYDTMKAELGPLLAGLHKGGRHQGKTPTRQWRRLELAREIESLERQFREAVQSENFETAACYRDQLETLRAKRDAPIVAS